MLQRGQACGLRKYRNVAEDISDLRKPVSIGGGRRGSGKIQLDYKLVEV